MASIELERELIIEEYKACRELIGRNIEIIERNEVFVIGACAGLIVFSFDERIKGFLPLAASWIPLLLAFVGATRFRALSITVGKIDDYLEYREILFGSINFTNHYRYVGPHSSLLSARWLTWIALFLSCAAFGYYRTVGIPLWLSTALSIQCQ